jgi:hypothetical protein
MMNKSYRLNRSFRNRNQPAGLHVWDQYIALFRIEGNVCGCLEARRVWLWLGTLLCIVVFL